MCIYFANSILKRETRVILAAESNEIEIAKYLLRIIKSWVLYTIKKYTWHHFL